jgi:hypothetical protein
MPVTLFARNLLEEGTVTAAALAEYPATRLYDRDRGQQWQATAAAPVEIVLDAGAPVAAAGLAIANHNIGASSIIVASSPDGVTYTTVTTAAPGTGAVAVLTFAETTARYWRVTLPAVGTLQAGELMLGVPLTFPTPELQPDYQDRVVPNVQRDRSPGGYSWTVKRGPSRREFRFGWTTLDAAAVARLQQAYAESDEGAKRIAYVDPWGVAWWVEFTDDNGLQVQLGRVATGAQPTAPNVTQAATITLQEAL